MNHLINQSIDQQINQLIIQSIKSKTISISMAYHSILLLERLLSQEDVSKLKALRQRCQDLNNSCPAHMKGRKPNVRGHFRKLMKRSGDGKLVIVTDGSANGQPSDSKSSNRHRNLLTGPPSGATFSLKLTKNINLSSALSSCVNSSIKPKNGAGRS